MNTSHVNVAEAKRHFSDLLGRVAYGKESITITRRGKPMAKLVPISSEDQQPHLADVQGWLDEDDPFFSRIDTIVSERAQHVPRALERDER